MYDPRRGGRWMLCVAGCVFLIGCGADNGHKIVTGTVLVGGQTPDTGEIRFIPIDGTPGSMNAAVIVGGKYRIEGRGGLPIGKYRVEIVANKKTGKQVEQYDGFEMALMDEELPISPSLYAGKNSPLVEEVASNSDGNFDFDLPLNE